MTSTRLAIRPSPALPGSQAAVAAPVREFLDRAVACRLLDPHTVVAFLRQYADRLPDLHDPAVVGDILVQAGRLTAYQLDRVLAGTTHGLALGPYRVLDR